MSKVFKKKVLISTMVACITISAIFLTIILVSSNIYGAEKITYDISNDWGSGAIINVTITNTDSSPIDDWVVTWIFPENQKISNMWNANYTQNGNSVKVSGFNWNSIIPAKGSVNFGFQITYSGTNSVPSDISVTTSKPTATQPIITQSSTTQPSTTQLSTTQPSNNNGKPRVIVSTDIGGTDFDDYQSLVHLLVYADVLDIEGIISSPHGNGRLSHILNIIDKYEGDYPNLKTYSKEYPTADELRSISVQGETELAPYAGFRQETDGSKLIIKAARNKDPRPLHVLVWGSIEDVAQALHDAPDIEKKIFVYYIGGPNKKWGPDAYQYIEENHRNLSIIEANSTYRGWFTGGNQTGDYDNSTFISKNIKGKGMLGDYFNSVGDTIKMGDTPSLARLLNGEPKSPADPSWGGKFVKAWERPHEIFNRITTSSDTIETFSVLELWLPVGSTSNPNGTMKIDNQNIQGFAALDGTLRFRYTPKASKSYTYTISSNVPELDGKTGGLKAVDAEPSAANNPSPLYENWWTDDPSPSLATDGHQGAVTVNMWREQFLDDFAERMIRCEKPNN
ncbi:MAG: nucleoside hydrolase-like domain-containing protein [Clostridiales bacterium]